MAGKRSKWKDRGNKAYDGPVANRAVTKDVNRKSFARLGARLRDYELMMATKNPAGGTQQRKDNGGFHRPGSNQ